MVPCLILTGTLAGRASINHTHFYPNTQGPAAWRGAADWSMRWIHTVYIRSRERILYLLEYSIEWIACGLHQYNNWSLYLVWVIHESMVMSMEVSIQQTDLHTIHTYTESIHIINRQNYFFLLESEGLKLIWSWFFNALFTCVNHYARF